MKVAQLLNPHGDKISMADAFNLNKKGPVEPVVKIKSALQSISDVINIKEWLSHKRKIKLHFTPTYSSWLNQTEIWFNMLAKDVLKGGVWKSTEQLSSQLLEYIDTYNKTRAKPFAWTYTGEVLKIS